MNSFIFIKNNRRKALSKFRSSKPIKEIYKVEMDIKMPLKGYLKYCCRFAITIVKSGFN